MTDKRIAFFDLEINPQTRRITDIGAVDSMGATYRGKDSFRLNRLFHGACAIAGHNIIDHDLAFLPKTDIAKIDTLYLSALLFPQRQFHHLAKDEKILSDELNNPVSDAKKAQTLFALEVAAYQALPQDFQEILCALLSQTEAFSGFFQYLGKSTTLKNISELEKAIRGTFNEKICSQVKLYDFLCQEPIALAFVLALIRTENFRHGLPSWVVHRFPVADSILNKLCAYRCENGCPYCNRAFNARLGLQKWFGFPQFRMYANEPLQERAVNAALQQKSILAIFPTGGGKSLTFQLPALMAGENTRGLTVIISPLQSLMKDQVDHLTEKGIDCVFTINGLLNPIERSHAIEAVANGSAKLLYISPEQLRSRSISRLLKSRRIERFVIDEAHCFSAWGHDFRVDYLYIGDFIAALQKEQGFGRTIPVSCFTATAKQKVIQDICDYFEEKLNLHFDLITTTATRENLHYRVLYAEDKVAKYARVREFIQIHHCPTIIYVSRTAMTEEIATHLQQDGFRAGFFHGKMDPEAKVIVQDAFNENQIDIMVATNAFGMGVDKSDVGLVIHWDISPSLENYVQEAGRAGRDPHLSAQCVILFNEADLDKHFSLLTRTKLTLSEIQQLWRAVKHLTKDRTKITISDRDLAREAGWKTEQDDLQTRVRTAIAALERAGYLKREENAPRIYATGIRVQSLIQGAEQINASPIFQDEKERVNARRILQALISSRRTHKARAEEAESRIDFLADRLALELKDVIASIAQLREAGLLDDNNDMTATITATENLKKARRGLEEHLAAERFLIGQLGNGIEQTVNLKALNNQAQDAGLDFNGTKTLRSVLHHLRREKLFEEFRVGSSDYVHVRALLSREELLANHQLRSDIANFVLEELFSAPLVNYGPEREDKKKTVSFSVLGLLKQYRAQSNLLQHAVTQKDIEKALLFLQRTGTLKLDGGFLVLYNALTIKRLISNTKRQFRKEDYKTFENHYELKYQQIHIVGEFANLMMRDAKTAMKYVSDYFNLPYKRFIERYFKGQRQKEIERKITPGLYKKIYSELSEKQKAIVSDPSQYIAVVAGPGSGKTRVLVHKLAALLTEEDVHPEQLLMLTFSRAAATEFKSRLIALIGKKAHYVDVKTFHSWAFDLIGRLGCLEESNAVITQATKLLLEDKIESSKITKSVLVIDETQDINAEEAELIHALIERNDGMRVIAVGDDDQNIYEFRGSSPRYFKNFIHQYEAQYFDMLENYRSPKSIVEISNAWAKTIGNRIKTAPCISACDGSGIVKLTEHKQESILTAVAKNVIESKLPGKRCVLTQTNDDALVVFSLLQQAGVASKLIQSHSDYSVYDLLEVRSFLNHVKNRLQGGAVISQGLWKESIHFLKDHFASSAVLENVLKLLENFEAVTRPERYFSDLEDFLRQSLLEDSIHGEAGYTLVSTIHKAKGKEFDNVWMVLRSNWSHTNEHKRAVYVGLTRAKKALIVHYASGAFPQMNLPNCDYQLDETPYPTTDEIIQVLTHKDVFLDFFIPRKETICQLRAGESLRLTPRGDLSHPLLGVLVRFSQGFKQELQSLDKKGFVIDRAQIEAIVAWKKPDSKETVAVLLPRLTLKRQAS